MIGFEAATVQWRATTTSILNGTVVHVHELAKSGKPVVTAAQQLTDQSMPFLNHLRRCAPGEQYESAVLRGNDAIRVVKYREAIP